MQRENDIPKSNILTLKYTWTNTQRKYSTQKLAHQGQIKANQEQMRNDKKISEVKKALTL